jgi:hypothetical protein
MDRDRDRDKGRDLVRDRFKEEINVEGGREGEKRYSDRSKDGSGSGSERGSERGREMMRERDRDKSRDIARDRENEARNMEGPLDYKNSGKNSPPRRRHRSSSSSSSITSAASTTAGVGMTLGHATPLSDGFCVVTDIRVGGPVHMSLGYEQDSGEERGVQVGDWLLQVNGISCKHMPRDEIRAHVVGPVGTKVVFVFAARCDRILLYVSSYCYVGVLICYVYRLCWSSPRDATRNSSLCSWNGSRLLLEEE